MPSGGPTSPDDDGPTAVPPSYDDDYVSFDDREALNDAIEEAEDLHQRLEAETDLLWARRIASRYTVLGLFLGMAVAWILTAGAERMVMRGLVDSPLFAYISPSDLFFFLFVASVILTGLLVLHVYRLMRIGAALRYLRTFKYQHYEALQRARQFTARTA